MKQARSSSLATDKGRSRHKSKRNLPVFFRAAYFKDAALAGKDGSFRSYVYFLRFFRCLHSLANRKRENLQGVFDPLSIRLLFSTGSHGSARRPRVKGRLAELLLKPSLTLESHSTDYLHPDVFHSNIHRSVSLVQTLSYV